MELTHDEIIDNLEVKYKAGLIKGCILAPGIYEFTDIKLLLKSLLPKDGELKITIDDIRLRPNLTINKKIRFTKISFFYTTVGLTQLHSRPLGDIEGYFQLIPEKYNNDNPINITAIDKVHLKSD